MTEVVPQPSGATELRTFLIADVRGYTRFTVEHGDEAAARLTSTFARLARQAAGGRGGEVIELRGDEALAVFTSARQALRAAIDLQILCVEAERADPSLPLRVGAGVDAGEAVPVEGGYRGAALNLAARLCSLAGPREVLASEGVIHLARRTEGLAYAERGLVELKGFVEPVRVIQVLSEKDSLDPAADPPDEALPATQISLPIGAFLGALPPGPLAGRGDEIARLLPTLEAVEAGNGQLVMLAGEPGIGKTRLAQEVAVLARDRAFLVATGRCYESERDVPLVPFAEAISIAYGAAPDVVRRRAVRQWPQLGRLLENRLGIAVETEPAETEAEDRHRLFRAVAGFLAEVSQVTPVALLVDDLQWADEGSLRLLQHLARQTRAQRVLLVATYRESEVMRDSPLDRVLRELTRERLVDRITVRRLDADHTAEMLAATVGDMEGAQEFAAFVHRRTKGNPYFIEEMVRALGGRYRLVKLVGAGGMGRVFQAVDTKTGKVVAAKILFASSEADLEALLRFQQEGTVLSTLKHPNIVAVYGTFLEEHTSCIVMEMLEGRSFGRLLQEERPDLVRIKGIAQQTAEALAYAHSKGIIHRDVKPDNIMVLAADRVKVTDFGIARILRPGSTMNTMTGMTLGTPLYMAPEQIEGRPVDGRADVYSLGAVLYQAVAGRPPFEGDDPITVAFRQVHDAPEPPSRLNATVPQDWETLILKALAKDPADRYSSAHALERAVAALSLPAENMVARSSGQQDHGSERPSLRVVTAPTRMAQAEEPAADGEKVMTRGQDRGVAVDLQPLLRIRGLGAAILAGVAGRPAQVIGHVAAATKPSRLAGKVRQAPRRAIAIPAIGVVALMALVIVHVLTPAPAPALLGAPVAGWSVHTSEAPLNFPQGVAADRSGIVYVADTNGNRIARFSATGTPLSSWGARGSAPGQFASPSAVAVDGHGDVYVADRDNNRIQKLDPGGIPLAEWGTTGTGNGQFREPVGVGIGPAGTVYVADRGNSRIQELSADGHFVRQWPLPDIPVAISGNIGGLAVDRHGDVYVSDQANNRIDKFSPTGRLLRPTLGGPGVLPGLLNAPAGIAVDPHGNVFVADSQNGRIQEFSAGRPVVLRGAGSQPGQPLGIGLDPEGHLLVADAANNAIRKLTTSGQTLDVWTGRVGHGPLLDTPNGLGVDTVGNLYIADTQHARIDKVSPGGELLDAWGTRGSGPGQFRAPWAVALDGAGNIYVADALNNRVQKLSDRGLPLAQWGGPGTGLGEFNAPSGLTLDAGGDIFIADTGNNRVEVLSPAGVPLRQWGSAGVDTGQFETPYGVAVDTRGTVYAADQSNNRVQAFSADGHFLHQWRTAGNGRSAGALSGPQGVAAGEHGAVYVADTGNNRLLQLSGRGALLRVIQPRGSGAFSGPAGIAVDAAGDAYVADTGTNRVLKIARR